MENDKTKKRETIKKFIILYIYKIYNTQEKYLAAGKLILTEHWKMFLAAVKRVDIGQFF